jgi:hypothetical protein
MGIIIGVLEVLCVAFITLMVYPSPVTLELRTKLSMMRLNQAHAGPSSNAALGIVSLTFDEGLQSQYDLALPMLLDADLPATFYILPKNVGSDDSEYIDKRKLLFIQAMKQEIGVLTPPHSAFIDLSPAERERQE